MIEINKNFKCSSCDICHDEKSAELMCTFITDERNMPDKACWCVCNDCEKIIKDVDSFFSVIISERHNC